jgi:HlyD family secretion protein
VASKQNADIDQDLQALKIPAELRGLPSGRARSGRRRLWLAAGTVGAAIVLSVLLRSRTGAIPVTVERPRVVSGAAADTILVASGYAVPHHELEVGTKVMGKVAWIGVEKGDHVKKGQLLVRLEDQEYQAQVDRSRGALATAEANYRMAQNGSRPEEIARDQAEMEDARVSYERTQELTKAGVFNQQQLDDAQARYQTALKVYELTKAGPRQEMIDQARAAVDQVRGDLNYAQTQLDATRITSPLDATVLDRSVEPGELVTTMFTGDKGAKSYVVSLADLTDIRVELDINENDFARVSMNEPCDIVLDAYPDKHYVGKVVELSPEANREKGTVQVKVQFTHPDDFVRPQMQARVAFLAAASASGRSGPSITIPGSARIERDGHGAVFVVENGVAHRRTIETADADEGRVRVTQGLGGSEDVIVIPPADLRDGARVTVNAPAAGAP